MESDRGYIPGAGASWLNALLGVWLIISPWVLGFAGRPTAFWNTLILGILVLIAALCALGTRYSGPSRWNVVFGIWLIISPWVLGYAFLAAATTNAVVLGIIVGLLALAASRAKSAPGTCIPA